MYICCFEKKTNFISRYIESLLIKIRSVLFFVNRNVITIFIYTLVCCKCQQMMRHKLNVEEFR